MQKFFTAYYDRRHMPLFIFLLKKLLHLYPVGFCNQDLHHVNELKNFAANILLKLVVSHVLGSMHRLISHVLRTVH